MSDHSGAPNVRFPPPAVYVGLLLLGPLIGRMVAVPPLIVPWPLSATITLVGLALIGVAIGLFRKAGEDPQPWTPSKGIIETGLYRYSRNPMYLGMAIAQAGLAMLLGNWISLALVPVAMVIIQTQVIAREERYLGATFGAHYAAYTRRVRRWI